MHTKIKSKQKFLCYTILYMYVCITYYTKIRSKRKFKIRNIKLSKISLPTVLYVRTYYSTVLPPYSKCWKYISTAEYDQELAHIR